MQMEASQRVWLYPFFSFLFPFIFFLASIDKEISNPLVKSSSFSLLSSSFFFVLFYYIYIDVIFKVIMATNRIESLDPALIRPGRIDRKIEFPLPDEKTKRRIFQIHTSSMTLAPDVDLEEFVMAKDDLSGADIKVYIYIYMDI